MVTVAFPSSKWTREGRARRDDGDLSQAVSIRSLWVMSMLPSARPACLITLSLRSTSAQKNPEHCSPPTSECSLARECFCDQPEIEVATFSGLAVNYARERGATTIVRGLRAVSDFEYEFKLAHMNAHLAPEIDVVCLMTSSRHSFVSSSLIREVASLGGNLDGLVPDHVRDALEKRFGR